MALVNDEGMLKSRSVIRKVSNGYEPSVRWKGILVDLNFCESDHFSKSFCVDGICRRGCSEVGRKNKYIVVFFRKYRTDPPSPMAGMIFDRTMVLIQTLRLAGSVASDESVTSSMGVVIVLTSHVGLVLTTN